MPSGAKKIKFAKKKKVQHISLDNPDSSAHSQGRDEKEVEKRDGSSSGQLVVSNKSSLEVGLSSGKNVENVDTEEGIVQIEWELKSEDDYGSKEGSNEAKQVQTGGSSGSSSSRSSSSSSDDESQIEKKTQVTGSEHAVDSVRPVDSLSEVAKQVDTSIPAGQNSSEVTETASVVTPDKASLVKNVVQVNESAPGDYSATPVGCKLENEESADKRLPSYDDNTGISPVLMDLGLRKDKDKVVSSSGEKPAVYVDVKDSATTEGKDDKLLLSFNAPYAHDSNDADDIKVSKSPECSESQPLVASAPQAVQKTSLKSCCGIFELFTSSDR